MTNKNKVATSRLVKRVATYAAWISLALLVSTVLLVALSWYIMETGINRILAQDQRQIVGKGVIWVYCVTTILGTVTALFAVLLGPTNRRVLAIVVGIMWMGFLFAWYG